MDAARAAERAKHDESEAEAVANPGSAVANLLANGSEPRNCEDPLTRVPLVRGSFTVVPPTGFEPALPP